MKKELLIFLILSNFAFAAFSQTKDSTKSTTNVSGSVNVTNNGISLVPNFSLGEPAVIVNLSAGKSRFTGFIKRETRFYEVSKDYYLTWEQYQIGFLDVIAKIADHWI